MATKNTNTIFSQNCEIWGDINSEVLLFLVFPYTHHFIIYKYYLEYDSYDADNVE